jgi:hypothetical protein
MSSLFGNVTTDFSAQGPVGPQGPAGTNGTPGAAGPSALTVGTTEVTGSASGQVLLTSTTGYVSGTSDLLWSIGNHRLDVTGSLGIQGTDGRTLKLTGGPAVSDVQIMSASQTWNNGAVAFNALKLDVTSTAAAPTSNIFDIKSNVNGARLTMNVSGAVSSSGGNTHVFSVNNGGAATLSLENGSNNNSLVRFIRAGSINGYVGAAIPAILSLTQDAGESKGIHINTAGNVGVGTYGNNTPLNNKLTVSGSVAVSGSLGVVPASGSASFITPDGGIGATSWTGGTPSNNPSAFITVNIGGTILKIPAFT